MIEIIKNGRKRKIECSECGCIFRYEREDVGEDKVECYDSHVKRKYVVCPGCDAKLEVLGFELFN